MWRVVPKGWSIRTSASPVDPTVHSAKTPNPVYPVSPSTSYKAIPANRTAMTITMYRTMRVLLVLNIASPATSPLVWCVRRGSHCITKLVWRNVLKGFLLKTEHVCLVRQGAKSAMLRGVLPVCRILPCIIVSVCRSVPTTSRRPIVSVKRVLRIASGAKGTPVCRVRQITVCLRISV